MGGSGLRTGCNLLGVILCLAAGGCASLPAAWMRVDGRHADPKQLSSDRATCEGEIKANLATSADALRRARLMLFTLAWDRARRQSGAERPTPCRRPRRQYPSFATAAELSRRPALPA
jgi:hypothetical protein